MDPALALELSALERCHPIHEAIQKGDSEIQKFYSNAVVFLTGGSGFLGKQLIYKLLRSCNDINKVYILMRMKKNTPIQDRLDEIIKDPAFDELRSLQPGFKNKIIPIEGDLAKLELGISVQDKDMLAEEVDVIIHNGATVRFDDTLQNAVLTNVRGTRDLLKFGKTCKKLRSFVHVSTAFSHATKSRICTQVLEQFYEVPIPPSTMIEMAESMDTDRLDKIYPSLIADWPNTYTFTKALGEEVVRTMSHELPVCIVRPAIVISSYKEPRPGWIDLSNVYGPSGLILGLGLGIVHVFFLKDNVKMTFVPVDFCDNLILAAAWETYNRQLQEKSGDIKIYTIACYKDGHTLAFVSKVISTTAKSMSTPFAVWYADAYVTGRFWLYILLTWILHYIPAYALDAVRVIMKKRPKFVKIYTKIYAMSSVFFYFNGNRWTFDSTNSDDLYKRLNASDKVIYDFDLKSINWEEYLLIWCIGIRKYIMKDGLKGTTDACRKQFFLKIIHHCLLVVYAYVSWKLLSFLFSLICYFF